MRVLRTACGSNRTRTGGRRGGLLRNLAVGQRLFQFGDARVGDLGEQDFELQQLGQSLEVHQPRVGDLGAVEAEVP